MTPSAFSYARPSGLRETIGLLHDHGAHAQVLAGGQSLIPLMVQRLVRPRLVIDINRLPELDRIELDRDQVRIGALVRQERARLALLVRAEVPGLAAALDWVASPVIRERGTLVGNLALNAAGTELPAVAIALGATFMVRDPAGERQVTALDLLGPDRRLPADALITHVLWPRATGRGGFYEVARRVGHAPLVGAMVHIGRQECRIGLCGVTAAGVACRAVAREVFDRFPERLPTVDIDRLLEQDLDAPLHGNAFVGASYRRDIAAVVIQRAIDDALRRAHP